MRSSSTRTISRSIKSTCETELSDDYSIDFVESEYKSYFDLKQKYKVLDTIGQGGQASVRQAYDMASKEPVAFKIFSKRKMSFLTLDAAHKEHQVIKSLSHPNIIEAKDFYEDNDHLVIINELMSSDIRSMLVELTSALAEDQIKKIFV